MQAPGPLRARGPEVDPLRQALPCCFMLVYKLGRNCCLITELMNLWKIKPYTLTCLETGPVWTGPEVDPLRQALPCGFMLDYKLGRNYCFLPKLMNLWKIYHIPLKLDLVPSLILIFYSSMQTEYEMSEEIAVFYLNLWTYNLWKIYQIPLNSTSSRLLSSLSTRACRPSMNTG